MFGRNKSTCFVRLRLQHQPLFEMPSCIVWPRPSCKSTYGSPQPSIARALEAMAIGPAPQIAMPQPSYCQPYRSKSWVLYMRLGLGRQLLNRQTTRQVWKNAPAQNRWMEKVPASYAPPSIATPPMHSSKPKVLALCTNMSTGWKDIAHITLNTQFNFESVFEAEKLHLQRNLHTLYIEIQYILYTCFLHWNLKTVYKTKSFSASFNLNKNRQVFNCQLREWAEDGRYL